ncbi:MAG TPA: LytTR family DNA-binding domain-containing protein [Chitinophaga sp.]|uniref:LytR/AlgR family response regulator transcription factor n=1 Tax=Chitinophaga sp. TaxID=1869181 RepID=UPI002F922F58
MKCIAVDDEAPSLYLLEDNIRRVPFLKLVRSCSNALEAMEVLQQEKIDLIFLDIEMPELTGLAFLKSLTSRPLVIFTTAYKKYAIEGYSLDVLDYLLKPIPFDRFLKAVNKAYEYHTLITKQRETAATPYLFVFAEYSLMKVDLQDILYIEALKDYVKIFLLSTDKPIVTKLSMKAMEERLPAAAFMRIHKSFIVALNKISFIRKHIVKVGAKEVPLGDSYRDALYSITGNGNAG